VRSCDWVDGHLQVKWKAPAGTPSDYYEIQLSRTSDGQAFGIFSTAALSADIDSLSPSTTYWVRVRAHARGTPSLGPGTWSNPGAARECRTGAVPAPVASTRRTAPGTMTLEVMRESEFTYDVDYLMNHNSGSLLGDVSLLTFSTYQGWLNVTMQNATYTVFCVDIVSTRIPDTITTGGNDSFADYASCNNNENATDPQCECDISIDRRIGGLNVDKYCRQADGSACHPFRDRDRDCHCNCTRSSLQYSATYTGMMPVFFGGQQALGAWYSHPKATECAEHEELRERRSDGTVCTWKRRPAARVMRGWQVLEAGWNASSGPMRSVDPGQVAQNAAVVRKVLASQPMLPWQCGGTTQESAVLLV